MPMYEQSMKEKHAVVIDIGRACTKIGFAGESGPRGIVRSVIKDPVKGNTIDIMKWSTTSQLFDNLVSFVNHLYLKYLLVSPKDRRVLIVESILTPTEFRNTLARVLFSHYEVASVLFAPSHLLASFTVGVPTALVVDVGYTETLVVPVYEGRPIIPACQSAALGTEAIHQRMESLMLDACTVTTETEIDARLNSVLGMIDEEVVEDVKVRACFVASLDRGQYIQKFLKENGSITTANVRSFSGAPMDAEYMYGNTIIHVPGCVREVATEVLFECDNERTSVSTILLDTIVAAPVDTRRALASNILITGGTASLLGFTKRVQQELMYLVTTQPYKDQLFNLDFKFHNPPSKSNYTAWLGGAIFGSLDVLASRSLTAMQYKMNGVVPDWCRLDS